MSVLHASGVSFRYPTQHSMLLSDVTLDVAPRDRLAIVGDNGSGKSTLLALLAGALTPASGAVVRQRGVRIVRMHQQLEPPAGVTLLDVASAADDAALVLAARLRALEPQFATSEQAAVDYAAALDAFGAAGGWTTQAQAAQVLAGLGVPEARHDVPFAAASGGQRSIAQLARLLVVPADIALVDEPTNHLDAGARAWLGDFVAGLDRALVFVSHDRAFLARVATRVVEVRDGGAHGYDLDWPSYVAQRELEREQAWTAYEAGERRRRATERAVADRERTARKVLTGPLGKETKHFHFRARAKRVERTAKVISRRLERQPPAAKPIEPEQVGRLTFPPIARGPEIVVDARDLRLQLGDHVVLDHVDLQVARGERVLIAGRNGSGKSTLLRALAGQLAPAAGDIALGRAVTVARFAQDAINLDLERSALAHALDTCPDRSWATTVLACLRVRDRELQAPVGELSPGRRTTVALALAVLAGANLLLLDEPTNHLDLETRAAFEDALTSYPGTLVFASHDAAFAAALTTRVIDLDSAPLTHGQRP